MADETETAPASIPDLHHSLVYKDVYAAFIAAQKEFKPVAKKKTATVRSMKTGATYTYHYADLADVLTMALPVLNSHDLGLMQPHILYQGKLRVCTRLIHSSGQWLQTDGINISEMVTRQDFGTDSTYDRRYDLCSMLGIAAEEDIDAQIHEEAEQTGTKPQGVMPRVRQPGTVSPRPPAAASSEAEKFLEHREAVISELKKVEPNGHLLGQRAAAMFPQHKSTKTLTVADLERLLDTMKEEKQQKAAKTEPPKPEPTLEPTQEPFPDDIPDVAEMFENGSLTTANRIPGPTIGRGLAQRLHKLISIHNIHTDQELLDDYLKPLGLEHASDLPRDMYGALCDWAEGKLVEGTNVVDPT